MVHLIYKDKVVGECFIIGDSEVEIKISEPFINLKIDFSLTTTEKTLLYLNDGSYLSEFEIFCIFEYIGKKYYVFRDKNGIYVSSQFSIEGKTGIPINISIFDDRFYFENTNGYFVIKDNLSDWSYTVDERIFMKKGVVNEESIHFHGEIPGIDNPYSLFNVSIGDYHLYFEIYRNSRRFATKYLKFRMLSQEYPKQFNINCITYNKIRIEIGKNSMVVKRDEIKNSKKVIGSAKGYSLIHPYYFEINNSIFLVYTDNEQVYLENINKKRNLISKFRPHAFQAFGKFYCFGKLKYSRDVSTLDLTKVITNYGLHVGTIKLVWTFFFFTISLERADRSKNFHNPLWLGNFIHPLWVDSEKRPFNLAFGHLRGNSIVLRLNGQKGLSFSVVPQSEQYKFLNRVKQHVAYYLVRVLKKAFRYSPKVNLYFEKDCSRAEESGFRVFQNVVKLENLESKNYFVLDERTPYFAKLKEKYQKNLVKRFSFKHYYLLFMATHIIGSELSNHVVEVRVLNYLLSRKINSTPLYFLQHGIMYAKSVDSASFFGLYNSNRWFNLKKSVISSDLEAEQFYKMGYTDSDLMKTGLATYDYARLDNDANKIVFMPTYRDWEEREVISGRIKTTTYYSSIMEVIKAFESRGLIDHLLITPHNKFSKYIREFLPEYRDIICDNPSIALRKGRIFITDISSAIYDSIFRGAYPIYYWKDMDFLVKHYGAQPVINEENAPAVIARTPEQLLDCVFHAMDVDYKIEKENLERYRKINEFSDRKNTQRIIKILKEDHVL